MVVEAGSAVYFRGNDPITLLHARTGAQGLHSIGEQSEHANLPRRTMRICCVITRGIIARARRRGIRGIVNIEDARSKPKRSD